MKTLNKKEGPFYRDILFLEASSNYTLIHYRDSEVKMVAYTLNLVAEKLSRSICLFRPNRKFIVNLSHVDQYDNNHIKVKNKSISISRRRKVDVKKVLMNHFNK